MNAKKAKKLRKRCGIDKRAGRTPTVLVDTAKTNKLQEELAPESARKAYQRAKKAEAGHEHG